MLATAIALLLQAQAGAPFDFKGLRLGSPIAELRAQTPPPGRFGPRQIACLGDPGASLAFPADHESEVGVTRCGVTERIAGDLLPASTDLTPETRAEVEYSYFEGRLFRIEVHADATAEGVIGDALRAKFGSPSSTTPGSFQVQAGATFPQGTSVWRRGAQSVTLITPFLNLRRLIVIYLDQPTASRVEALVRARHNPADAM